MDQGNILGPSAGRTGEAGKTAPQPVWEAKEVITRERGGGGGRVTQRGTEPETPQLHIEPWLLESAETTTNESPTEEHLRIEGRATEEAARDACNMEPKPRGWPKDLELSATGIAGTDGNTTSSWMNDWRANTLGSTRRANNLRKKRGAPR